MTDPWASAQSATDGIAAGPRALAFVNHGCACIIVSLVWCYRFSLRPVLGGQCRHQPTCSQYMLDAVEKYGPYRGAWRGIKRLARCGPWGGCGHDPA
ncbi:MAG: membrane protein insertion efficiency factor YidD [Phycisphaeraceae bacterium]|nr:membrane protein insertion efficiency factor YidD [Phycisphaeraceae bacterium]